jgi:hypothetical protein
VADRVVATAPTAVVRGSVRDTVRGGIVAGLVGAAELALFRVGLVTVLYGVVTYLVGSSRFYPARFARSLIWSAVKLPAYPFVGERALEPGFVAGIVLLGVVVHLVMSTCWGVLFGFVADGLSSRATLAIGLLWGVLMWWVCYFVVLPLVGPSELARSTEVIVLFVPYGLAMAAGFLLWKRVLRRWITDRRPASGSSPR